MNKKIALILILAVFLAAPFLANSAHAQASSAVAGPLQMVLKVFVDNFGFILNPQDANIVLYLKLLFALIIILPVFFVLSAIFKGNKAIAGILSVAIGLLSVMFISNEIILSLATTYGGIATIIFYAIPIAALVFIYKFIESALEETSKTLAYAAQIAVGVLGFYYTFNARNMIQKIPEFEKVLGTEWISFILLMFAIFIFLAAMHLLGSSRFTGWNQRTRGRWYNPVLFGGGGREGGIPQAGDGISRGGASPSDVEAGVSAAEQELQDLRKKLSDFNSSFNTTLMYAERDFAQDATKLTDLQKAMSEVSESIKSFGGLWKSYETYSTAPGAVQATINDYYSRINARQADIQTKLNNISAAINSITTSFGSYGTALAGIINGYNEIKNKYQELAGRMNSAMAAANSIEKNIDSRIATISAINPRSEVQNKSLRDLQEAKAETMNIVDQLKNGNEVLQAQISPLTQIITGITNAADAIAKFKNEIQNIYSNINKTLSDQFAQKEFEKASESLKTLASTIGSMQQRFSMAIMFVDDARKKETDMNTSAEKIIRDTEGLLGRIIALTEKWKRTIGAAR